MDLQIKSVLPVMPNDSCRSILRCWFKLGVQDVSLGPGLYWGPRCVETLLCVSLLETFFHAAVVWLCFWFD